MDENDEEDSFAGIHEDEWDDDDVSEWEGSDVSDVDEAMTDSNVSDDDEAMADVKSEQSDGYDGGTLVGGDVVNGDLIGRALMSRGRVDKNLFDENPCNVGGADRVTPSTRQVSYKVGEQSTRSTAEHMISHLPTMQDWYMLKWRYVDNRSIEDFASHLTVGEDGLFGADLIRKKFNEIEAKYIQWTTSLTGYPKRTKAEKMADDDSPAPQDLLAWASLYEGEDEVTIASLIFPPLMSPPKQSSKAAVNTAPKKTTTKTNAPKKLVPKKGTQAYREYNRMRQREWYHNKMTKRQRARKTRLNDIRIKSMAGGTATGQHANIHRNAKGMGRQAQPDHAMKATDATI